jgi:hypothetical protein
LRTAETIAEADSWASYHFIPAALHAHMRINPQLQLHMKCPPSRPVLARLDKEALSSPSLHTLQYTIFCAFNEPLDETSSEFAAFRSCITRVTNLKVLTLEMDWIGDTTVSRDFSSGPRNLQFDAGDTWPALEELTFSSRCYDSYVLSAAHCKAWTCAMDWTKLRALDLGHATPQHLLPALTNRIPGLKKLRMGFWPPYSGARASWSSPGNLGVVTKFVESIDALEDVTLSAGGDSECKLIRPALLRKHGASLKRLVNSVGMRESWPLEHFVDLQRYAPGLEELDISAEMYEDRGRRADWIMSLQYRLKLWNPWEGVKRPYERTCWPTKVQRMLCSFRDLRHLTLRVQLMYDSYQFVPDGRLGARSAIKDKYARKTALELFKGFGQSATIQVVHVVFSDKEPSVVKWTYTVRRRWCLANMEYRLVVDRTVEGEEEEERRRTEPFDPFI